MSSQQAEVRPQAADKKSGPAHILKIILRTLVRLIPGGRSTIEPSLRKLRLKLRQLMWSMSSEASKADAKENHLLIDPAIIEFCPKAEFAYSDFRGASKAGDWDLSDQLFDKLEIFESFNQACKEKSRPWNETSYYKRKLADIESGKPFHGCKTREEFDARCENLSAIYESIANEGYKSQEQLGQDPEGEIAVAIGREGKIFFSDGAHRLSMAKLLGVKEVPVVVAVRHPKWAAFRAQLKEFCKTQSYGKLYQQALHPDLLAIPSEHGCEDRFEAISANLPVKQGRLLDIGANLAYMCNRFEDEGFDCTAIEIDETHLYIMEKIRKASGKNFEIRSGSFLDDFEVTNNQFEVVLALNIFHHFLKAESDYIKLIEFLKRLKTNIIVFEPHLAAEPQMQTAFKNYPVEEFCAFVMEHAKMTQKKKIFGAHDGREVFILSR